MKKILIFNPPHGAPIKYDGIVVDVGQTVEVYPHEAIPVLKVYGFLTYREIDVTPKPAEVPKETVEPPKKKKKV